MLSPEFTAPPSNSQSDADMAARKLTTPQPDSAELERKRIAQSIAWAEASAGEDDARFAQLLESRLRGAPASRSRAVIPIVAHPLPQRSFQVHRDPHHLANTRHLARRNIGGLRVTGGETVPPGDFLDCVAVGNDEQWGCTGTLIAPSVVVTAGRCADFSTRIYVGRDVSKKGKQVRVAKRLRHSTS